MAIFNGSSQILEVYYGSIPVNKIVCHNSFMWVRDVTITITPDPSDATVTLTATGYTQSGNSITVSYGTIVTCKVQKSGYTTKTVQVTATDDRTIPISLVSELTLTINPTPADAIVTFDVGLVSGNSCVVPYGTTVTYTVHKQYYNTQTATINVTSNQTINVTLTTPYYIPAVNEVICDLNGASKKDDNTLYVPGRYEVLVQAGDPMCYYNSSPEYFFGSGKISQTITVSQGFIIRAYCGSYATPNTAGTNPYSGTFKVNPVNGNVPYVNHIFGNSGGVGKSAGSSDFLGTGNCLGNGSYNSEYHYSNGAGSCLHLMPANGTFGTNYLFAFHTTAAASGVLGTPGSGSAYGGAGGGSCWAFGQYISTYGGGSTPYGTGGAGGAGDSGGTGQPGTGIGHGYASNLAPTTGFNVISQGAAAWFNGTNWVQGNDYTTTYSNGRIYIKYLGQ